MRNATYRTTSRHFLVLQYVVFKDVPVNLAVRVTAFAQEKSASEKVCVSELESKDGVLDEGNSNSDIDQGQVTITANATALEDHGDLSYMNVVSSFGVII